MISGNRPIHEMIRPNLLDQRKLYIEQFQGMASDESTYEELEAARTHLIETIEANLTDDDRSFLLSLKKGDPKWGLLGISGVESLPGVRWKLMNINKMKPDKHKEMITKLEEKFLL